MGAFRVFRASIRLFYGNYPPENVLDLSSLRPTPPPPEAAIFEASRHHRRGFEGSGLWVLGFQAWGLRVLGFRAYGSGSRV